MDDLHVALHMPLDCLTALRQSAITLGQTTRLATPVSSSRVMKQTPLALPGRCLTRTRPASLTFCPLRLRLRSAAEI